MRRTLAAALIASAAATAAERHHTRELDTVRARAQAAERDRAASEAASKQASERAATAAAQERALAEQRVAAAARLREAEIATDASAERIGALARQRTAAEAALQARAAQMAPLLPLIERISLFPVETMLAVPQPPGRALRSALVIRGLATGLEREASALRADEAHIAELSAAEEAEEPRLADARAAQAKLAAELDRKVAEAERTRSAAEDAATAADRHAAEAAGRASTLQGVLADLSRAQSSRTERREAPATQEAAARPPIAGAAGPFTAPVVGTIVQHWGDSTPAGAATGISWRSAPLARVVAPCSGHAVFAAPFRSYGQLVILDCGGAVHAVLGGMQRLDIRPGAQLTAGEPVGEMPDWNPRVSTADRPTLYFELRRGEQPVDPRPYLRAQG